MASLRGFGPVSLPPDQSTMAYDVTLRLIRNDAYQHTLLPGMTANLEFVTETVKDALLVNNSAFRFRPTEEMLEEIKPRLIEKAKAMLPDSLQQNFNKALNNPETYAPANFKKRLPSNIDGFFYQDANGKLDFKFVQLGIKSGLQSEIKRFLDGNEMEVGSMAINSIKSKE